MHVLDTDTLTHLHAGHQKVIRRLSESDDPEIAVSIVTRIEVLQGRFNNLLKAANGEDLLRAQERLDRTELLLSQVPVLRVDERSRREFDRLSRNRRIRRIGRPDLLIAAIVLGHRATLVTRNLRHFQEVPGLKVVNWVD